MKILLTHGGKQHSYHVAKSLMNLGFLSRFITSGYLKNETLQFMSEITGEKFFNKRFLKGLKGDIVESNWRFEFSEFVERYFRNSDSVKLTNLSINRGISFDEYVSKKLHSYNFDIFWGYNGSCYNSLISSKRIGKKTICETQLAYIPFTINLLKDEANHHPEWADTLDSIRMPKEFEKRLIEEPIEADNVIAISSFLKSTLVDGGVSCEKIDVIPLGFELGRIKYIPKEVGCRNGPLKILYAGRITQHKGIKYLLDAMNSFNRRDIELHVIGSIYGSGDAFRTYKNYYYHGSMHQLELFSEYNNYDVLVMPSLSEGFGLVSLEAMAAGLPVITTVNTNATDIIEDGIEGYIIPIRDTQAIVSALEKILSLKEEEFIEMSKSARMKALDFTWDNYQLRVEKYLNFKW